jgi:hypothetical protein
VALVGPGGFPLTRDGERNEAKCGEGRFHRNPSETGAVSRGAGGRVLV